MDPRQRLSLNQMTVKPWSLRQAAEGCGRAGIPAIGVWRDKLTKVEADAKMLRDVGLRVSGLCRGGWFDAPTPAERRLRLDDNRRAVEEAAILGAPVLVLVCGPAATHDLPAGRAYIAEAIAGLAPYAAQHGVRLGIEPMHPMYVAERSVIATLAEALAIARHYSAEQVGVVVDTYHVWWDPEVLAQIAVAGPAIAAFHLADWLVPTPDMLNGRGLPGEGVIDFRALWGAVDGAGYTGDIEVEIFNNDLWSLPGETILQRTVAAYEALYA